MSNNTTQINQNSGGLNPQTAHGDINIYDGSKPDWRQYGKDHPVFYLSDDESNKLYYDKDLIENICNHINGNRICVIEGSEGRGKTTLCRIVAHRYHSEKIPVFFCQPSDNGIIAIYDKLIEEGRKKTKTLIVFENVHRLTQLGELTDKIKGFILNKRENQLHFLLNARPSEDDYETILERLCDEKVIHLKPTVESCTEIAKTICVDTPPDIRCFISERIFSKKSKKGATGGNLRLLRHYLDVWNKGGHSSLSEIREEDILDNFKLRYNLRNLKTAEKKALLYLGSIYQFDIPLSDDLLENEVIDTLNKLYTEYDVPCFYLSNRFYLPHSVDAGLLCKAYKESEYVNNTFTNVKEYVEAILRSGNPRQFEADFIQLVRGLAGNEKLQPLIRKLIDWKSEEIVKEINPGFVLTLFDTRNGRTADEISKYYEDNAEWINQAILSSSFYVLGALQKNYSNYLQIPFPLNKIFDTPQVLEEYLSKQTDVFGVTKKSIREMGGDYASVLENFINNKRKGESQEQIQYSFLFRSIDGGERISNNRVLDIGNPKFGERVDAFINKIKERGFYFDNLSWKHLGKLVSFIANSKNPHATEAVNQIIDGVLYYEQEWPCFEHATAEELSLFLKNIKSVSEDLFDDITNNGSVIEDAKKRIENFNYTQSELYLFGHFYSQDWCKEKMNSWVDSANGEQKITLKTWHDKVKGNLENGRIEISENSLVWYIHEKCC